MININRRYTIRRNGEFKMTVYTHAIRTAKQTEGYDPQRATNFSHVPFTDAELRGAKVIRCHHHNKNERYLVVDESGHFFAVRKLRKDDEIDKRFGETLVYKIHVVEIFEQEAQKKEFEKLTLQEIFERYNELKAAGNIVRLTIIRGFGFTDEVNWMKDEEWGIQINYNENQTLSFNRNAPYTLETNVDGNFIQLNAFA